MSQPFIRTVLGDIDPQQLGRVNYHEHLFQVTPLLPGDEIDDEGKSRDEAALTHAAGIDTIVDATPWGLGRNPAGLGRISLSTGLQVVATAGFHRAGHYSNQPEVLDLQQSEMVTILRDELLYGQRITDSLAVGDARGPLLGEDTIPYATYSGTGAGAGVGAGEELNAVGREDDVTRTGSVRAGMMKAGVEYWSIPAFSRRVIAAIGEVHLETGAPVMVHLEHGSAAHEVLGLFAEAGVAESSIVLAHIDRSPDPILYSELASRGAFLGCDGAARLREFPESTLIHALAALVHEGFASQVVFGGDVARASRYLAYGGIPGIAYLTEKFVPRAERVLGAETITQILVDNPRRLLTWHTSSDAEGTEV